MSNTCDILDSLIEDHVKFLLVMADIVGHTISNQGWIRARSYLSPSNKFRITDPIMMAPEIFAHTQVSVFNHITYKERQKINLYVKYDFMTYENAACNEFLLRGAFFEKWQPIDLPGVTHKLSRMADDQNKIIGVLAISKEENSSIYDSLIDILPKKRSNCMRDLLGNGLESF